MGDVWAIVGPRLTPANRRGKIIVLKNPKEI